MSNIAFIFARGGSKGLPKKNTRLLNGKPLIQYSIETAINVPQIHDIYVSSDDSEILDIAVSKNIKIIKRPAELATDNSPEWLSWQHAINFVQKKYGNFANFISLPTTSPLRLPSDVSEAIKKFQNGSTDICISITESSRSPYFNMVKFTNNDNLDLVLSDSSLISRRQDAPCIFDITTAFYIAKVEYIKKASSIFDGKVGGYIIPKSRAIDIDDIYDFIYAETLMNKKFNDD